MSESNVEKGILEAFQRELERAVSDAQGVGWNGVDSIRKYKLLLMGIRNFPEAQDHVAIQQYLNSDMLPHLDDQPGPIQTNAGVSSGPIPEVDKVKEFYAEEMIEPLEDILTADTFYWLKTYYENREIPFKQACLTNMGILLHITRCARFCDLGCPNTTLLENLVSPIEETSVDLKRELIRYPLLRNLPPFVAEFTHIATQVMTRLEEQDLENPGDRAEYTALLNHLSSFYYKGVWRPISNRIGYYAIHGLAKEDDREFHVTNLKRARQNSLKLSNQFRSRTNDYGLRAEIRNGRIPKLRPEERDFQELLQWGPEDDTARQVTTVWLRGHLGPTLSGYLSI